MELESKKHKALLLKNIIKITLKTIFISFVVAIFFNIPLIVRENTFSQGLAYAGQAMFIIGVIYALFIAFKKYQQIILPFDKLNKK
jgi:hypothetical protein